MIASLVQDELALIGDEERRRALQRFLVTPFVRPLRWPYPDKERDIAAWVVAADAESGTQLVYTQEGFAGYRWAVASSRSAWAGVDDSWFSSLDDAFIGSGLWRGPLPEGYEVA